MPKEIERFDAESEDGFTVTIVYTGAPGIGFFATPDGEAVKQIDDDTFEIVRTSMIVKRIQS